jgi:zinc transport system permease protein
MGEILSLPFMQRAFIGGILVGFLASYYGVFVVQRGLSFLGSGLAHAAFGGVALGILLEKEPLSIALPFTVLVAIGINWVRERTELNRDTTVGIFFAVSMALGILFLFLKRQYTSDAFTYLFGSILAITNHDLWMMSLILVLTFICAPLWNRWAYASFDRELAEADRLTVVRDDYVLVILISVTIVAAIKLVGIILIAACLVIPAATARILSHTFSHMTLYAIAFGILSSIFGLVLSYYLDVPSGATIILVQALFFILGMVYKILK